jgi:hypothetical protein
VATQLVTSQQDSIHWDSQLVVWKLLYQYKPNGGNKGISNQTEEGAFSIITKGIE